MPEFARAASVQLEGVYNRAVDQPSDINEHLPLLRELAAQCEHVTEFGLRAANGSTVALLAAQPATFITWDISPAAVVSNAVAELCMWAGRTKFQPRVGNTLEITTEPTDLLFVDTFHTARQLKAELERHVDPRQQRVRKYLVFHDTTTFGLEGEDGSRPGLRAAIRWFQKEQAFPLWQLVHDRANNNGLVVLKNVCADGHGNAVRGRCPQCGQAALG